LPFLLRALVLPERDRSLAARGHLHLRGDLSRRGGTGHALRHAIPPREEPALGAEAARELRGLRAGRAKLMLVIPAIDLRRGRCVRLHQGRAESETVFSDDPVAMARRWEAEGASRLHVVDLDGAFGGGPAQATLIGEIVRAVKIPVEVGGGLRAAEHVQAVLEAGARWAIVGTRAALDPAFLGEICRRFEDRIIVGVDASGGVGSLDDIRQLATIPGVDGVIVGRALYSGAVDLRAAVAEAR